MGEPKKNCKINGQWRKSRAQVLGGNAFWPLLKVGVLGRVHQYGVILMDSFFFLSLSLSLMLPVQPHTDLTLLHSCTVASFVSQSCRAHLIIPSTHSRWLKLCHKKELRLTWSWSVGEQRHEWKRSSNSEAKRSTAAAATIAAGSAAQ